MMATIVFWMLVGMTIGSAAFISATPKLIHAAFALFVCLIGVAGLFVWQGADFLGAAQIIVYVGGVLILMMFGVMLSRRGNGGFTDLPDVSETQTGGAPAIGIINVVPAVVISVGFFLVMVVAFSHVPLLPIVGKNQVMHAAITPTHAIGIQNLTAYLIPFEIVGVLLLIALIGAAYVSRRPPPQPRNTGSK